MFEELNAFAAVVEQSSLNRASKLLNLSQPALSRKIAKLEDELGVSLFHRRGKRLELTSVGQFAYTFAVEQKQQQQKFLTMLAQYKDEEQSTITLGASLTTLQTTLPPLVNAFMEKHPNAELKLLTEKHMRLSRLCVTKKPMWALSPPPSAKWGLTVCRFLTITWNWLCRLHTPYPVRKPGWSICRICR